VQAFNRLGLYFGSLFAIGSQAMNIAARTKVRAFTRDAGGAPDDFSRMAGALDGDGFARFMSDEARGSDWARVVASLPKIRYLKAAAGALRPGSAQGSP
jgi:hypothetical protein